MVLPPWLDRLWLTLIAISFFVIVPLYTIHMAQQIGWANLIIAVATLFGLGFYRGLR